MVRHVVSVWLGWVRCVKMVRGAFEGSGSACRMGLGVNAGLVVKV